MLLFNSSIIDLWLVLGKGVKTCNGYMQADRVNYWISKDLRGGLTYCVRCCYS